MALSQPVFPSEILGPLLVDECLNQRIGGQAFIAAMLLFSRDVHALVSPYRFRYICVTGKISMKLLEQALEKGTEKELANIRYVLISDLTLEEASNDQSSPKGVLQYLKLCGQFYDQIYRILPFCAPSMFTLTLVNSLEHCRQFGSARPPIVFASLQQISCSRSYLETCDDIFPMLRTIRIDCKDQGYCILRLVQIAIVFANRHPSLTWLRIEGFVLEASNAYVGIYIFMFATHSIVDRTPF
jgi:hypothetical protein